MRPKNSSFSLLLVGLALAFLQTGCGSSENVYAKYLVGRITFGTAVSAHPGAPITIRFSSDNFATIAGTTSIYNDQGLLTLPYRLDFPEITGNFVQIQAFQDLTGQGVWTYGSGSGRYDKTATGNAAYLSLNRIVGVTCASGQSSAATGCMDSAKDASGVFLKFLTLGLAQPEGDQTHYISGGDLTLDSNTGL